VAVKPASCAVALPNPTIARPHAFRRRIAKAGKPDPYAQAETAHHSS
jgi:hypothetical protein